MCKRAHVRLLLCLSLAATLALRTTASATHATSSGGPAFFANEMLVTPGEAMAAASAPFKAVERVAVIELSFTTRPFPFSNAQVQSAMATLNTYIQEASYGKRSVTSTIVGPFMSSYAPCSGDTVREALALADPFLDYTQFDSFYVILNDGCSGPGGSVFQADLWDTQDGTVAMGWAQANINTDLSSVWRYYTHEFGHNQGLGHADSLDCGDDAIRSDNLATTPGTVSAGGCQWREYRDRFDTMGFGGEGTHYNAPHKFMLGFFDPTLGGELVQDVTTGTYTIGRLETPGAEVKALRLARGINGPDGAPEHLWVEYRQPVGFDAPLDPTKLDGVFIHIDNMIPGRSVDTLMVDATPTDDDLDTALRLNQSVWDPVSLYRITLVGRTSTTATVQVSTVHPVRCHTELGNYVTEVTVPVGQQVHLRGEDALGVYTWSQGGTPATGNQQDFYTTFASQGSYSVRVDSGGTTGYCTVNVVPAGTTGAFIRTWGTQGTAVGQFQFPWGTAVDSAGNVYVADTNNNRVQKFNAAGVYQTQFGGGGAGAFNGPRSLAIATNGEMFVVDTGNHRIVRLNASGVYLDSWGTFGTGDSQFNTPNGIDVDGSYVYVTDTGNQSIKKFTKGGNHVKTWGSAGSGNGQFSFPRGIAVSGTSVWVTDWGNNRVQTFSKAGAFKSLFSTGPGTNPRGVAIDPINDRIYVVEETSNRVSVWSGTSFVQSFTGGFAQPMGVAASSTAIYVADTYNQRMEQFTR
jgi:DNA-binding beta-propeller fold protein YncE